MRRLVTMVLVVLACAPAEALGQAVVAGPTPKGWTITARDHPGGALCAQVRVKGKLASEECGAEGRPGEAYALVTGPALAGYTGLDVAAVEAEYADATRLRVPTTGDGAYAGAYAGTARWFLADREGTADLFLLRMFAADGTLLGAAQPGRDIVVGRPHRFARGRVAGERYEIRAEVLRGLSPIANRRDRVVDRLCVLVERFKSSTFSLCRGSEPLLRPALTAFPVPNLASRGTETVSRSLVGFVGPGVAAARARLGSGRVVRLPLFNGAFGYPVPPREALVAVEALDAAGATVATLHTRVSPATLPGDVELGERDTPIDAPAVPVKPAHGGALGLREVGDSVCAEIGAFRYGEESGLPCTEIGDEPLMFVVGRRGEDGFAVGGLVPPGVAKVEVSPFGSDDAPVTAVPAAYDGRWAGHAQTFYADVPVNFMTLRLLDAEGRQVGPRWNVNDFGNVDQPARAVHAGLFTRDNCPGLGEIEACYSGILVVSSCKARRVAVVFAARRHPGAVVVTADGKTHRPFRFGSGSNARYGFVAPRGTAPRLVRWRGGRLKLGPVEPATRQCGYITSQNSD